MSTSIYLVRHGDVENSREVFYGRLPWYKLSREGIQQACRTGEKMSTVQFVAAYSSPLLRAKQTASAILEKHPGLKLKITQDLHEVRTPFDGQPIELLIKRKWDIYSGVGDGYEQPLDVLGRVQKFVRKVRAKHANQQILAVTHGDLIAFMILWAKGMDIVFESKVNLKAICAPDDYPARASITIVTFSSDHLDEKPSLQYIGPNDPLVTP